MSCTCEKCVDLCKNRPCWGTPKEIKNIINAGFGNKLMLDYWVTDSENILIVSPAIKGFEWKNSPFIPTGECSFLLKYGLCEIHEIKPLEGREGYGCKQTKFTSHKDVASLWDNDKARKLVEEWRDNYFYIRRVK